MFLIYNTSIATADDVIQFGDDVNKYPVYLSRAIIVCGNCLNWLEKTIVSDHIFCQFLVSWFGNSLMTTECKSTSVGFRWNHLIRNNSVFKMIKHDNNWRSTYCYIKINPTKPSDLFVGHRQTVQTKIRRRRMRRLIRVSTVCLQKIILNFKYKLKIPLKWKWIGPIDNNGNSI